MTTAAKTDPGHSSSREAQEAPAVGIRLDRSVMAHGSVALKCPQCGGAFTACAGRVNRAAKINAPLYCGKPCASLARRLPVPKTPEQKKAEKVAYDRRRRDEQRERLLAEKRAYYEANRPRILEKMAEYRKERMPKHVEYCRRPEYRAKKHEYDLARADAEYGEFAEAWRLLLDLEKEIRSQATAYERRVANGYYTRNAQKRRRELCRIRRTSTPAT